MQVFIYVYPVKSLRPIEPQSAVATKLGFEYDRRFMLLKVLENGNLENMHVAFYPELVRFFPAIDIEDDDHPELASINISHEPVHGDASSITLPLLPDTDCLVMMDIEMHGSPTSAFDMGREYNDWFSKCLGYRIKFAYLGRNTRPVLMSADQDDAGKGSWISPITNFLPTAIGNLIQPQAKTIGFADCAPYLVVSNASLNDVSRRMTDGQTVDIEKFRPNIIIDGANEAWEEDFWAELDFGNAKLDLLHNCVRCQSLNIDYETGKFGTGETGKVFRKLQSDRRVDKGAKYSPVFGRYSFLHGNDDGQSISVGDEVAVTRRNDERTIFDWPGLS
ncbi:hypothetical protein MBLNU457_2274t1 [Dothideomycetes sp. NU457]